MGDAASQEPGDVGAGGGTLDEQRRARRAKLERYVAGGGDAYPDRFERTATSAQLKGEFAALDPGTETDVATAVAGRVVLVRRMGKLQFLTLQDGEGTIQLFVSKKLVGDDAFAFVSEVDLGDWLGAEGEVMSTKAGELSVRVREVRLLTKALRPLPDKWRGLSDLDTRYRQRYVDLVVNAEARRIFEVRHGVVAAFRDQLEREGFVEAETPLLQVEAGGATARPFVTHHNALDLDLYLRIAPELFLKRLVVGGLERVYELGRVFRNEGLSTRHNPEFTILEAYQALANYEDMMALTERLVVAALERTVGGAGLVVDGRAFDLTPPWPRYHMSDLIEEHMGVHMDASMSVASARAVCRDLDVPFEDYWGAGRLLYAVFDKRVEHRLMGPLFACGFPTEVSPLAKPSAADPLTADRFELFVAGRELANGYSELNDPERQRAAFEHEVEMARRGDEEAQRTVDEDYLRALEYGLPPTGGLGIGVDRVVMAIAGVSSIREVILFPTLRPEQ